MPKCPLGRPAGGSGRLSAPSWAAGGIWRRSRGILGGLREGSRGGVGRLQGRFSLFGGGQDGLRGSFWQTLSDILSKSVWQTRGRAENASKNALVQPGTRQFLNVLSSLRLARFGTTGAQTDIGKNQNSIRGSSFFALTRRTASAAHEAEEQTKELKSRPLEASENRRSTRAKKLPKIIQKWLQNRSKLVPGSLSEATRGAKRRPVAPQRPQEAPGREPEKLEIRSPLVLAHL